jgi:hypothetical protein
MDDKRLVLQACDLDNLRIVGNRRRERKYGRNWPHEGLL